jgi:tetratricopeptide (TPR) repeat protein
LLKPVKLELPPANAGKEKGGADETEEAVPATARKGKERGGGAAAEKRAPAARDEEDEPVAEARGFDGLMAKGDRYRKEGECGKALDPYLQAAELKPGYSEIHYKIGECYRHTGQHARAVTYYEKAINLSGYRNAYIGVAKSLSSLGRKADAKDYLKKGLERYEDGMMRMMLQELGN